MFGSVRFYISVVEEEVGKRKVEGHMKSPENGLAPPKRRNLVESEINADSCTSP